MDDRSRDSEAQGYAASLEHTLKELQHKVGEHEAQLAKIRSTHGDPPPSPRAQAAVLRSALERETDAEPFLPVAGSALPALVALRKTHRTVVESRAHLAAQRPEAERLRRQLDADRARLRDQRLLSDALDARVGALRLELGAQSAAGARQPGNDGARRRIAELEAKRDAYDAETSRLMRALLGFIGNHLAAMLAAEELGGPVVGDAMDIDPDDLAAGFNAHGKPRKKPKDGGVSMQEKRQRRIDDIWGAGDEQQVDQGARTDDEAAAAGREMRELTEELLNTLVEARGDNSASYVKLARESAAARFLVRSKVAQFHPKDATRLRLIDFGRELES